MNPRRGFSLIELLVALAVFAALAMAAWGGLAAIARTRGALAAEQDRFAATMRAVAALERDLRHAIGRSVRSGSDAAIPAFAGDAALVEFTRLGHANPLAEPRSNLERVVYAMDGGDLRRARYDVLDRAANSVPHTRVLLADSGPLRMRYLACDANWHEQWPPREVAACAGATARADWLPRAVEFRIAPDGLGEIRRIVELPASLPREAVP